MLKTKLAIWRHIKENMMKSVIANICIQMRPLHVITAVTAPAVLSLMVRTLQPGCLGLDSEKMVILH